MSLVTRCPKCQSDFMVSLEQLRVHEGLVRCGSCTHIFDGHAALESQLPVLTQRAQNVGVASTLAGATPRATGQDLSSSLSRDPSPEQVRGLSRVPNRLSVREPVQEPSAPSVLRRRAQTGAELGREPDLPFATLEPEPFFAQVPRHDREPAHERESLLGREPTLDRDQALHSEPTLGRGSALRVQGEARSRDESRPSAGRGTPDFLIDETPLDGLRRGLWLVLALLAGSLLLMQLMYVYRNELVTRMPSLLPTARAACVQLRCEVSFVRHLERITVESTALEQAAAGQTEGQSSNLTFKFSMRNRNDKIQPWPHLSVELKDASGTVVIRKVLTPELYLPESMVGKPFGANQELHLSVPIVVNNLQISSVQLNRFFP